MKFEFVILIIATLPCSLFAQTKVTGDAKSEGPCSIAISGNNNIVNANLNDCVKQNKIMKAINDEHHDDFTKQFSLGYKLFGIANKEVFPFQGTPDVGFSVNWLHKNYSAEFNDEIATLRLPDINIQPNMMLHETTVSLPNELGSSITFRLDPKSFQRGVAIISNTFERVKDNAKSPDAEQIPNQSEFPIGRIVYLTASTVRWGTKDYYELGKIHLMDTPLGPVLWIEGGVLGTSRVNIFDDATCITGNKFIGGPRGGYVFPKAGNVSGNDFFESTFDASRIPDGAIVASNGFKSAKGVYRIGPEPQISFVVKIIKTEKDGTVLLFGAKPYVDDE